MSESEKFVVRLFDYFDGWIDVTGELSKEDADKYWNEKTANGTKDFQFKSGGSYYAIFPANTRMIYTPESLGR